MAYSDSRESSGGDFTIEQGWARLLRIPAVATRLVAPVTRDYGAGDRSRMSTTRSRSPATHAPACRAARNLSLDSAPCDCRRSGLTAVPSSERAWALRNSRAGAQRTMSGQSRTTSLLMGNVNALGYRRRGRRPANASPNPPRASRTHVPGSGTISSIRRLNTVESQP